MQARVSSSKVKRCMHHIFEFYEETFPKHNFKATADFSAKQSNFSVQQASCKRCQSIASSEKSYSNVESPTETTNLSSQHKKLKDHTLKIISGEKEAQPSTSTKKQVVSRQKIVTAFENSKIIEAKSQESRRNHEQKIKFSLNKTLVDPKGLRNPRKSLLANAVTLNFKKSLQDRKQTLKENDRTMLNQMKPTESNLKRYASLSSVTRVKKIRNSSQDSITLELTKAP